MEIDDNELVKIATPIKIQPKMFITGLYKAWRRCHKMAKEGESKEKIGFAFYEALKELFGEKK